MAAAAVASSFPSLFPPLAAVEPDADGFTPGQRVSTLRGGPGRIVGFYRTDNPTALVALDSGTTQEFSFKDLEAAS